MAEALLKLQFDRTATAFVEYRSSAAILPQYFKGLGQSGGLNYQIT